MLVQLEVDECIDHYSISDFDNIGRCFSSICQPPDLSDDLFNTVRGPHSRLVLLQRARSDHPFLPLCDELDDLTIEVIDLSSYLLEVKVCYPRLAHPPIMRIRWFKMHSW